jgi:hypothetical protein
MVTRQRRDHGGTDLDHSICHQRIPETGPVKDASQVPPLPSNGLAPADASDKISEFSPNVPSAQLEPFASAEVAARFVAVGRRELLAMARRGVRGAYPLDPTRMRKTWVFRLSELAAAITSGYKITSGSPR